MLDALMIGTDGELKTLWINPVHICAIGYVEDGTPEVMVRMTDGEVYQIHMSFMQKLGLPEEDPLTTETE